VQATRDALGWTHAPFEIPADMAARLGRPRAGAAAEAAWRALRGLPRRVPGSWPPSSSAAWPGDCPVFGARLPELLLGHGRQARGRGHPQGQPERAGRCWRRWCPNFFGGSADLTGSNLTNFKGCVKAGRDTWGNHLSYGVREFGMAAIMNGIALHGGFIPYGGTFLTFSDYSRNAIRMAALMKQRVIHVFTHDSIGLGEDGPTHQSVEHVPSLRLIPGLDVWRPADGLETAVAWACAVERRDGPARCACRARTCRR
jgi:transketolase